MLTCNGGLLYWQHGQRAQARRDFDECARLNPVLQTSIQRRLQHRYQD
jgi:hypothetical protein